MNDIHIQLVLLCISDKSWTELRDGYEEIKLTEYSETTLRTNDFRYLYKDHISLTFPDTIKIPLALATIMKKQYETKYKDDYANIIKLPGIRKCTVNQVSNSQI